MKTLKKNKLRDFFFDSVPLNEPNPGKNNMKNSIPWLAAGTVVLAIMATPLMAQPTETEKAELIAELTKNYPLETCVVSGDKLGAGKMGEPIDYIYEVQGKKPRLVRFCCKFCIKSFNENSDKYIKMIEEAAAKGKSEDTGNAFPAAPSSPGHEGHLH